MTKYTGGAGTHTGHTGTRITQTNLTGVLGVEEEVACEPWFGLLVNSETRHLFGLSC